MQKLSDPSDIECKEMHKSIDNTFDSMLGNLNDLFESLKYSDKKKEDKKNMELGIEPVNFLEKKNFEEVKDLQMCSSIASISNNLEILLKLVNKMKVKIATTQEKREDNRKKTKEVLNKKLAFIKQNFMQLQKNNNEISLIIKEWKSSRPNKLCEYIPTGN